MKNQMNRPLTEMQRAFVREYVIDFCGKDAAIRAGYSPKTAQQAASRLLQDPRIAAEIARVRDRIAAVAEAQTEVTATEIITSLVNVMRADIRDVVQWGFTEQKGDDGITVSVPFVKPVSSEDLPPHLAGAVASVSLTSQGTFRVTMHDKGGAIDKLMRHLGLYEADNKQKTDPLAELINMAQGTALPVSTRYAPAENMVGGANE